MQASTLRKLMGLSIAGVLLCNAQAAWASPVKVLSPLVYAQWPDLELRGTCISHQKTVIRSAQLLQEQLVIYQTDLDQDGIPEYLITTSGYKALLDHKQDHWIQFFSGFYSPDNNGYQHVKTYTGEYQPDHVNLVFTHQKTNHRVLYYQSCSGATGSGCHASTQSYKIHKPDQVFVRETVPNQFIWSEIKAHYTKQPSPQKLKAKD